MHTIDRLAEYRKSGLIEILGKDGIAPFTLQMEQAPSDPFVHGIMIRAGRAGFHHWLNNEGDSFAQADPDFQVAPVNKKIFSGFQSICGLFSAQDKSNAVLNNHTEAWELVFSGTLEKPMTQLECSYLIGFFQEFASWAGMGKLYQARGKTSASSLDECSIFVKKEPIE